MSVHRLNHAVLYVRDAERSAQFYEEVLGFRRLPLPIPGAVFMQAEGSNNDHDLGLFSIGEGAADSPAGRQSVGLYHLAWEVDTLQDLSEIGARLSTRRCPGRSYRPRHDKGALRQGPGRHRIRGLLAGARRPDH